MNIRLYQRADEAAVREICFQTALYGQPMQQAIPDPALISESLVGYYLRFEPDALWIAEESGQVVGYLSGGLDPRRYERRYVLSIAPRLGWLFLRHGHLFHRRSWQLLAHSVRMVRPWRRIHAALTGEYTAHCHINVRSGCQGQGVGRQLMARFLNDLAVRGVSGVYLTTATEAGKAFFDRLGFVVLAREWMPEFLGLPPHELWLMARRVEPPAGP